MEQTTKSKIYRVSGMTCDHCVRAVRGELGAIEAVEDVQVDLASGEVTIVTSRPVELAEIAAAVDEAGYELAS